MTSLSLAAPTPVHQARTARTPDVRSTQAASHERPSGPFAQALASAQETGDPAQSTPHADSRATPAIAADTEAGVSLLHGTVRSVEHADAECDAVAADAPAPLVTLASADTLAPQDCAPWSWLLLALGASTGSRGRTETPDAIGDAGGTDDELGTAWLGRARSPSAPTAQASALAPVQMGAAHGQGAAPPAQTCSGPTCPTVEVVTTTAARDTASFGLSAPTSGRGGPPWPPFAATSGDLRHGEGRPRGAAPTVTEAPVPGHTGDLRPVSGSPQLSAGLDMAVQNATGPSRAADLVSRWRAATRGAAPAHDPRGGDIVLTTATTLAGLVAPDTPHAHGDEATPVADLGRMIAGQLREATADGRLPNPEGRLPTDSRFPTADAGGTPAAPAPVAASAVRADMPAPAATLLASPSVTEHVMDQIVTSIRMQWKDGMGEATLHLRPEALGAVTVTLRVEAGAVTAVVKAESAQVQEWVLSNQQTLRQQLESSGLRLDNLTVSPDAQQRKDEPPPRQPRRQPRHPQNAEDTPRFELMV